MTGTLQHTFYLSLLLLGPFLIYKLFKLIKGSSRRSKKIIICLIIAVFIACFGIAFANREYLQYKNQKEHALEESNTHPQLGHLIELKRCSDVCPEFTRTFMIYEKVTEEQCRKEKALVIKDVALGGYIGCGPRNQFDPLEVER